MHLPVNPTPCGSLLAQVDTPQDLKRLAPEDLVPFCTELRQFLIEHAAQFGGHFGASLGVVELTTALHYVLDTPQDQLIWDVGHQAYAHKVLTGRRGRFHTNRLYGGVSGFPKRTESEYDTFGVGHSSTSISAAVGMWEGIRHLGLNRRVVAVIGDGAATAGMAYEALNHGGMLKSDITVVLNDNNMSIDPNVGALKEYLTDVRTSRTYNRMRDELWTLLGTLGNRARRVAAKLEDVLTAKVFKPGLFFEALGFRYFGPIDGHDVNHLVRILQDLEKIRGPKLLHVVTVKGKGFAPGEADATKWHAPSGPFNPQTGAFLAKPITEAEKALKAQKYQDVFGYSIIELAERNPLIIAVTPAMLSGSSLTFMQRVMPDRVYDVGIAEQHAATFSAGAATQGLVPYCHIYSTFCQRAYDQVIHDVAIQDLKVIFVLDRGGLVGADGATHHGTFDLAYMRCIPNMIVAAPMDERELRHLMHSAQHESNTHPYVIRFPRGEGVWPGEEWRVPFELIATGKGRCLQQGEDVAVLTLGHPGNFMRQVYAQLAGTGLCPAHYDMRFVKPLDGELLHEVFSQFRNVITVEDGCVQGGFGSAVLEWMADHGYSARVRRLGVPDEFIHHGTQAELWRDCGYDANAIAQAVREMAEAPVRV
jgi:1-deoxy-D-xylulose-5-phosphate synthase